MTITNKMAQVQSVDEFVKEYLLFRGFTSTLKAFDNELKIEKDKGFRVDRIVDSLLHCVSNYDLGGLRDAWGHLETKVFTRLDHHLAGATKKLEFALLKYYLVHAIENNKNDKVTEFFSKMTQDLGGQSDWKDWFTIPYIKYPEESPTFAVFFTRQWQESLFVSLHNFLASAYQSLPQPALSSYEESAAKMTALQKENEILRRGLANLLVINEGERVIENNEQLSDIMDDFYNISQEVKTSESQAKTLKSLMKISGNSSSVSPKGAMAPAAVPKTQLIKIPSASVKRPSSIDRRTGRKDREASQEAAPRPRIDPSRIEKGDLRPEGSFLFLSQDEYSEHNNKIKQLKLNGRGNMVASLDSTGCIRIWTTPPSCRTVAVFPARAQTDILEWVLHNERYLLSADPAGPLRLLDVKEVQQMWEVTVPVDQGARLDDVVSNPTESSALIIVKGKVLVMDLKTRKIEKCLPVPSLVTSCAFTPNGQTAACGCMDGSVQLVDIKKNELSGSLPPLSSPIVFVHLTFDGSSCFYLGSDRKLQAASLLTKEKVQLVSFPAESQLPVIRNRPFCLDSSGTFLLTLGTNSGVIYKIVDDSISKCLELGGHKHSVTCIDWCFANQCATCVTASSDGNIRISTLLIDTVSTSGA